MNRGFLIYIREGIKSAKRTLKNKGNLVRFHVYGFTSFLGKLIFAPVFDLADVRILRMAEKDNNLVISDAFKASNHIHSVRALFWARLVQLLIFLAGIICIAIPTALLGGIGTAISMFATGGGINAFIVGGFMIPGAIALLVYLIIYPFYMTPAAYIVDTVEKESISDTLYKSYEAMKKGKWTYFVLSLITFAMLFGYLLVAGILGSILMILGVPKEISIPVAILVAVIAVGGLIFFLPFVLLSGGISIFCLQEDLVMDRFNVAKVAKGVSAKSIHTKKFKVTSLENNLAKLFDETEDADYEQEVSPETLKALENAAVLQEDESQTEEVEETVIEENVTEQHIARTDEGEAPNVEETPAEENVSEPVSAEEPEPEKQESVTEETSAEEVTEMPSEEENKEVPAEENAEEPKETPVAEAMETVVMDETPKKEIPAETKDEAADTGETEETAPEAENEERLTPEEPAEATVAEEPKESFFSKAKKGTVKVFTAIGHFFAFVGKKIGAFFVMAGKKIGTFFKNLFSQKNKEAMKNFFKKVGQFFVKVFTAVKNFFVSLFHKIAALIQKSKDNNEKKKEEKTKAAEEKKETESANETTVPEIQEETTAIKAEPIPEVAPAEEVQPIPAPVKEEVKSAEPTPVEVKETPAPEVKPTEETPTPAPAEEPKKQTFASPKDRMAWLREQAKKKREAEAKAKESEGK